MNRLKPPPTFDQMWVAVDAETGDGLWFFGEGQHALHMRFDRSIAYLQQQVMVDRFIRECF